MRNRIVLPPRAPEFVKFEDWGTIVHFVPGAPRKEEEAIFERVVVAM